MVVAGTKTFYKNFRLQDTKNETTRRQDTAHLLNEFVSNVFLLLNLDNQQQK